MAPALFSTIVRSATMTACGILTNMIATPNAIDQAISVNAVGVMSMAASAIASARNPTISTGILLLVTSTSFPIGTAANVLATAIIEMRYGPTNGTARPLVPY